MDVVRAFPPGYRLRPPASVEVQEVYTLVATCDGALGSPPSLTEDLIKALWSRPRFVLEDDAWIVERGEALVGYAEVWELDPARLSAFALVHPDHTGRGIGSALAMMVEERAGEKVSGEARLFTAALSQDVAAAQLLAARGYEWARRFWHMEIEAREGLGETSPPPAGIDLRPLEADRDLPVAHFILEEAFKDHWDYAPTPFEEFLDRSVRREDFDPTLWIIAADAGEPVGVLSASAHSDRGWIEELGVLPSHRGRGVASTLLRESIAEFERRGLPRVRLNVDSDNLTGAVALYERVGMRAVSSYDLWTQTIQGPIGR